MRTMTKERKKEGPRLGHKGRADAKASRQLLLLCIPAIIAYILFNYIPMGAAVIIPFKNYKFSKGILGSDWCGLANFKWIIQSVALDRALRNTVLYGLLFMVLSPVTNVIIALLLFEITSRRRLKTYQTIITFPNFIHDGEDADQRDKVRQGNMEHLLEAPRAVDVGRLVNVLADALQPGEVDQHAADEPHQHLLPGQKRQVFHKHFHK